MENCGFAGGLAAQTRTGVASCMECGSKRDAAFGRVPKLRELARKSVKHPAEDRWLQVRSQSADALRTWRRRHVPA